MRANLMLNKVRRLNFVKSAEYRVQTGGNGDLVLTLSIALTDTVTSLPDQPIGWFADRTWSDFPTLYADGRTVVGAKLENKSMLFRTPTRSSAGRMCSRPEIRWRRTRPAKAPILGWKAASRPGYTA